MPCDTTCRSLASQRYRRFSQHLHLRWQARPSLARRCSKSDPGRNSRLASNPSRAPVHPSCRVRFVDDLPSTLVEGSAVDPSRHMQLEHHSAQRQQAQAQQAQLELELELEHSGYPLRKLRRLFAPACPSELRCSISRVVPALPRSLQRASELRSAQQARDSPAREPAHSALRAPELLPWVRVQPRVRGRQLACRRTLRMRPRLTTTRSSEEDSASAEPSRTLAAPQLRCVRSYRDTECARCSASRTRTSLDPQLQPAPRHRENVGLPPRRWTCSRLRRCRR